MYVGRCFYIDAWLYLYKYFCVKIVIILFECYYVMKHTIEIDIAAGKIPLLIST